MMNKFHTFHMVNLSPWPLIASIQTWTLVVSMTNSLMSKMNKMNTISAMLMTLYSTMWWKDTIKEAALEGMHQKMVVKGLKMGMILFILSEVLFFTSFFWAYFHSSISPNLEVGQKWPPLMIKPFDPTNVPLLNTLILISSGVSVTWAHHSIINKKNKEASNSLMVTCGLGVYFSCLQAMEYAQAEFCMGDATYGSTFFMATGFHGLHVLIGTTFLIVNLLMLKNVKTSKEHHLGFEMAAWYWHFVDVIWLFLYVSIYWWGK